MPASTDLKFGDVIRFQYGEHEVIAMVVVTDGDEVRTGEGTAALGKTRQIVVFGLVGSESDFHPVGETASFPPDGKEYEVIS